MKKAKIVLSAVALFAVVGGALAFKADRFDPRNVWTAYTTVNGTPYCSLAPFVTTAQAPAALSTFYKTTIENKVCATLTTTLITAADD